MSTSFNNLPGFSNPEWDRILSASQKNNSNLIEHLITNLKVSPDHTNGVGQSSLHVAALWGNLEACEVLLKHNANTNAQNRINGATPLHSAVQSMKTPISMRTRCIQKILEQEGCNPNRTDSNGFTPLTCLEKILEKESDRFSDEDLNDLNDMKEVLSNAVSRAECKRNPLFLMIEKYDLDGMKRVLEHDENVRQAINEQDSKTSFSPLSFVIEIIVNALDEMMYRDQSPDELEIAQLECLKNMVLLLLQFGAEVQVTVFVDPAKSDKEKDPFHEICNMLSNAVLNNEDGTFDAIISFLKEMAIGLNSKGVEMTPSTMSCMHNAARRGKVDILQFWIETLGVDVNVRGRQGLTALHFAARSGKVDVVKYLLQLESIDTSVVDDRGKTALDAALVNGRQAIVELIQQNSE